MSNKNALKAISAVEVKAQTSWLNFRKDTNKMGVFYGRKPSGLSAILALAQGTRHRQWRVAMVCCEVLGKAESHQDQALPSLYQALEHSQSSVRYAAAEALGTLAESTEVSARRLWDSLLQERDPLTAEKLAAALTAALPSDFALEHTRELLNLVQGGFQKSSATLPLKGGGGETVLEAGERESDLRDVYGIFTCLLSALGKAPGVEKERFEFLLSILNIWILCRHYSGQRVAALLSLTNTEEDKQRLLETAAQTSGQYAFRGPEFQLLTLRPEWAAEILRRRLARDCPWDRSNWPYRLKGLSQQHLGPVVELFQEFKGEPRATLFKLLAEAAVGPQVPGLGLCLESDDEVLVKDTLERLKQYRQPVPELLERLLDEARALLATLKVDKSRIEARLAEFGHIDPIAEVKGHSALDEAISSCQEAIQTLDHSLLDQRV